MSVEQALKDFELLLQRPINYFKLSPQTQWKIDEKLGCLDVQIDQMYITPDMVRTWNSHFGLKD